VPKEKQREAVKFLLDNAFTTPMKLLNPAFVSQFHYSGVANDVVAQQKFLLDSLLNGSRLNRLFDEEVLTPDKAYTVIELVNDLQDGLWSELKAEHAKVDPLRRNLQRAYVDRLKSELEAPAPAPASPPIRPISPFAEDAGGRVSELRGVARTSLQELAKRISAVLPQVQDPATKAHLEDSASQIETALNNKKK
jgi:hypothetical protein